MGFVSPKNKKAVLFFLLAVSLAFGGSHSTHASYEDRVKQYESADSTARPPAHAVLFVGSSSIEKWKTLAHDFHGTPVINRGVNGSQYSDLVKYSSRIIVPYHPKQIVLYSGENDIFNGKAPARVASNVQTLLSDLHRALPEAILYVVSIKPSLKLADKTEKIRSVNLLIKKIAEHSPNTRYIDIHSAMLNEKGLLRSELFISDGLHMNEKGYEIWKKIIQKALQKDHLHAIGATDRLKEGLKIKAPDCDSSR